MCTLLAGLDTVMALNTRKVKCKGKPGTRSTGLAALAKSGWRLYKDVTDCKPPPGGEQDAVACPLEKRQNLSHRAPCRWRRRSANGQRRAAFKSRWRLYEWPPTEPPSSGWVLSARNEYKMLTKTELQTWANGKVSLYDEFRALMEEDRIAQQGEAGDGGCVYVSCPEPGRFVCSLANMRTEHLQARFELLATKAGIALGARPETSPEEFWFYRLFLDLRANRSPLTRFSTEAGGFIDRVVEASATACAWLDRQRLAMSYQSQESEWRALNQRETFMDGAAVESGGERRARERSEKRNAVVVPILTSKGWKRCRWVVKAGVSKNSVYEYLSGKRNLSIENHKAMAEALELKPDEPSRLVSRLSRETSRDLPRDDKRGFCWHSVVAPRRRRKSQQ